MSRIDYPPAGFRYSVSIGSGKDVDASFSEVSGISAQLTTEEIIEGGENRFKHRLPLQMTYTPLVLKRGVVVKSSPLATWVDNTFTFGMAKAIELKEVKVTLLDDEHNPIITWVFENAYPIKYDVSGLKGDGNQLAIESMEFSYQRFYKILA